jgi:hypothetical protein
MKKLKNIPTYYDFKGTPIYRDTTGLPFKTGGDLFPSLYEDYSLENGDINKKKKNKKEAKTTTDISTGEAISKAEEGLGLDPNLTYYVHPSGGNRLFAKDKSGSWYEIHAGKALSVPYDPKQFLEGIATKATDKEAYSRMSAAKMPEVSVTGEKLSWQKYQDEYEDSNPRGEYLEKRKKNYLKSHPGLNRAMGVTMNNFPEDALARFNDKYNKERNTYALEKFVDKDLGEDIDKRGQWIDDVEKSPGLYNMVINSNYGYSVKPNIFSRTLAGAEKLVDWIPGVDPLLDWATGKNRYNDILTEKEQQNIGALDALAFTEYPGLVLSNLVSEGLDPNSGTSGQTFSGSTSPIVTANPQLNTMGQIITGAVGLPFNITSAANLAKNLGKGVSNVAKANYYNFLKNADSSVENFSFKPFATAEQAADKIGETINTVESANSIPLLNADQNTAGLNKILQNQEAKNIIVNEQVPNAKTLLSTEGEILPESTSWHNIMEDFNKKLHEVDLTKPLTDEEYIKAADAINPEINKVASLEEIKALHQDALNYFQGHGEPKDIALYIRNGLAEKLPSIGESPTMVEGYPTYSAGFSVSRSLDPNATQYYGPKSVYEKAKEWGYDLNNLTPEQQNILAAYTKGYDYPINLGKRYGFEGTGIRGDFYQKNANTLLDAILANKFPNETSVIRSIKQNYPHTLLDKNKVLETGDISLANTENIRHRGQLQQSDVIGDKGFLSTSLIPDLKWGKARLGERIMIPEGNKQSYGFPNASAASSSPFEGEIVLPSGLAREVVDVLPNNIADIVGYKYVTKILNPYLAPLGIGAAAGTTGLAGNDFDQSNYNAYGNMGLNTKAYGGPLNDRNINGKLLQSTYASPLGNMFREGGPFGEDKGTFDYATSIYASQPGNYYGNGGFTVTRSNDRKGKTHKVVRKSDGKTEYYGSEMRNQPKNEKVKAAAEARHGAQGNFKNPFFKAYWDATWKNGGPITKLNPTEEKTFQTFYNTLPENLQTDDSTYDIRGYWDGLGRPSEFDYNQPKESDGYYHGFSINPNTGEYLKSPAHETFQHAVDEDRKIGYRPITNLYGRNIATYNPAIIEPSPTTFLTNTTGPINYRTGGQFPRPYSLPEDSFKQGGNNLHNSVYASSNAQYPAIYKLGGNINVVAGGEKHRVYIKESPTGVGEGVKGHIMVNHPTMDKGQWDTIDLTIKAGAKTVADGIAATKKWHKENPNVYRQGGSVLSMSNTPQLQGEGKDLTVPENAYIYAGGGLIKRADGSYSQRGLWDNIRANAGSGKAPTKQMLQQEKKINKNYK